MGPSVKPAGSSVVHLPRDGFKVDEKSLLEMQNTSFHPAKKTCMEQVIKHPLFCSSQNFEKEMKKLQLGKREMLIAFYDPKDPQKGFNFYYRSWRGLKMRHFVVMKKDEFSLIMNCYGLLYFDVDHFVTATITNLTGEAVSPVEEGKGTEIRKKVNTPLIAIFAVLAVLSAKARLLQQEARCA